MSQFEQYISEFVWDKKYRYRKDNKIVDVSLEDTWQRVAKAAACCEQRKEKIYWEKKFYDLLQGFAFLPGGRIIAGAGVSHQVTLFNCFVMKIKEDSLQGIFDSLKEGALTLQKGGGIGYDFSILRPKGFHCKETDSIASGPVSFMKIWDSMSATMVSSAARRGAMMANLRCDHPDIFEFVKIKANARELRHFNLSVIITDEFMHAVKNDSDWFLVFPNNNQKQEILRRWSGSRKKYNCEMVKQIKARKLWQSIIESAYSYAEPGVIFEDTINNQNPLWYCEWISATNPCGEIPLPFYGACNLGSLNLTKFITNPFSKSATIDWSSLENATEIATRFLDNVIEISSYPLRKQQKAAFKTRRIGLGFTGLADAFLMLGISYGSEPSLKLTTDITKKIAYTTWFTSAELGKIKGSFPLFEKRYLKGQFVTALPIDIQNCIMKNGMRNSHHNAIAPTGSISLLANNISSGIEPIFAAKYERYVRDVQGEKIHFTIEDYALHQWKKMNRGSTFPEGWKDISSLTPNDHLAIQSAAQPYIDNAISKTINLPENFPLSELMELYTKAYDLGLKGCTIFRPNPVTGSVLSTDNIDPCCNFPIVNP